jgi:hypothetical protein
MNKTVCDQCGHPVLGAGGLGQWIRLFVMDEDALKSTAFSFAQGVRSVPVDACSTRCAQTLIASHRMFSELPGVPPEQIVMRDST